MQVDTRFLVRLGRDEEAEEKDKLAKVKVQIVGNKDLLDGYTTEEEMEAEAELVVSKYAGTTVFNTSYAKTLPLSHKTVELKQQIEKDV
jgi:hypothetical protein